MGKKLAIKGHATRGKEVIELLQMMGGHATVINKISNETDKVFFISDNENCFYKKSIRFIPDSSKEIEEFTVFTLEEFLEEYPHKVGDKVVDCYGNSLTIKSMNWLDDLETMVYDFEDAVIVLAAEDIRFAYDADEDNTKPPKMKNVLAELLEHIKTTPKEDLEREFEEIKEWSNVGPTVEEFRTFCECVNKKPKYPKTFKECRAILNYMEGNMTGYKASLFASLQDLLICRDAYWKIAGEEMCLDRPWKADFTQGSGIKYIILFANGEVIWNRQECETVTGSRVLAFPTAEMRDAFYENFKDLIEDCKELL